MARASMRPSSTASRSSWKANLLVACPARWSPRIAAELLMVTVTPLTGSIGADVRGLDLSEPLDEAKVKFIHDTLLEHLVLFFRDQHILTIEQHTGLALCFGELEITPFQREGDP